MTQSISCPICQLDALGLVIPDEQRLAQHSSPLTGLVAFTCSLGHIFFLRSQEAELWASARRTEGPAFCSALESLDDDLALICEGLGKLEAAKDINIEEVIGLFKTAAQSAQNVQDWVLSAKPDASWQSREELDACLKEIQRRAGERAFEEPRIRLLALATELERGSIVHRRASRVSQLNQLRDEAITELRSQAKSEKTPQLLPGPNANKWIEWACSLSEPEDSVFLRALGNGFPYLDDFVANLEPGTWRGLVSPISELLPEPGRAADKGCQERSRLETSGCQRTPVSSEPIPIKSNTVLEGHDNSQAPQSLPEPCPSGLGADKKTSKFCIYRKPENVIAVDPKTVDHEMFAHFGDQPNGMGYYFHWDEVIASRIARGEELDRIRAYFVRRLDQCALAAGKKEKECRRNYQRLIEITDWLDQNFTLEAVTATVALSNTSTPSTCTPKHFAEVVPIMTRQNAANNPQLA